MSTRLAEAQITRGIVGNFLKDFMDYITNDVIIIGGGPSGLTAAIDLASKGFKTLIVESNNYLGGGFWIGGYLMNKITVRSPGQKILDEIDVTYHRTEDGIFVADGPHACSKLIASACDAGAKILNMTSFEDVVINNGRVVGAVINWTPVQALPRAITCVDPIALESEIVIDATGHDAVVARSLEKRALIETKGFGAMNVDESERAIVEMTGEIFPGLILTGMSVATAYGLPRMGPTFCGVLHSGKKAAQVAIDSFSKSTRRMAVEATSTI